MSLRLVENCGFQSAIKVWNGLVFQAKQKRAKDTPRLTNGKGAAN
jgi:hypothetical protein